MNDYNVISNIKSLGIDMIKNAGSGHPGIVLSAAPIIYTLYNYHMNVNPIDSNWYNRDRFVLSAGHGSALFYSTLFMAGFNITINDLKKFRHIDSITPGHPEVDVTPGVDCTTGPLGQGIANSVGLALGEKILKEKYNDIDYRVYCLVGDGDLMEGISYEAASIAGNLKLNNLIVLYDSNDVCLDGNVSKTFTENVRGRFESLGWNTILVNDGNNVDEINSAIKYAKASDKPVLIQVKTKIGDGSLLEGTNKVHGSVLSDEDTIQLKNKLGVPNELFYYNNELRELMKNNILNRIKGKYNSNNPLLINNNYNLLNIDFNFDMDKREATRDSNHKFIEYLCNNIPNFIGGSADTGSTTKTLVSSLNDINSNNYNGNNIWYGVREHSMGAISNGLALSNLRPYCSTFLSFSDYLKPAMRLSALMKLPVTYIFSHDSINVGQDGPTHQPVEQLAMIRSIPNMKLFRPADIKELQGCWHVILNSNNNPSTLVLSRTEVSVYDNTSIVESTKGGYIFLKEKESLDFIIIATGTELEYANKIGKELLNNDYYNFRIVSMPSIEQFLLQTEEYRKNVLPNNTKIIVIEAGSMFGWNRISNNIECITIDNFGYSGTKDEVLDKMDYSYEKVRNKIFEIINSNK